MVDDQRRPFVSDVAQHVIGDDRAHRVRRQHDSLALMLDQLVGEALAQGRALLRIAVVGAEVDEALLQESEPDRVEAGLLSDPIELPRRLDPVDRVPGRLQRPAQRHVGPALLVRRQRPGAGGRHVGFRILGQGGTIEPVGPVDQFEGEPLGLDLDRKVAAQPLADGANPVLPMLLLRRLGRKSVDADQDVVLGGHDSLLVRRCLAIPGRLIMCPGGWKNPVAPVNPLRSRACARTPVLNGTLNPAF